MKLDKWSGGGRAFGLCALLLAAFTIFLYFQNLNTPYISLYDEGAHANVVRNLVEHCCVPHLHRSDLGTGYKDWLNNSVWLHKPMLPFYVTAGAYALFGETLWGLRFPGVVLALLTGLAIYLTGRRFFNRWTGICGAAIFCLNPFTHKFARGLVFAGFPDSFLVFFMAVSVYLVLDWLEAPSAATLRWLGLVVALGYLSKGGLALAPFAVLAGIAVLTGRIRSLLPGLQALAIFAVIVSPDGIYWRTHYPVEFRYEQHEQLAHLVQSIDGFGGAWYKYVTHLLPALLSGPLVVLGYFSIFWALWSFRKDLPAFTLAVWIAAYVVPLSFAVSKITNFIYPAFPAIALLIPHALHSLLRARKYDWIFSLCIASAPTAIVWAATYRDERLQFVPLLVAAAASLLALAVLRRVHANPPNAAAGALALTALAAFSFYAFRDFRDNTTEPPDGERQAMLRRTAFQLRALAPANSLILTQSQQVDEASHLYLMYWSGLEVLDICRPSSQPLEAISRLRNARNVYLIHKETLPSLPVLAHVATGYLYSLDGVSFDLWNPAATAVCPQAPAPQTSAGASHL